MKDLSKWEKIVERNSNIGVDRKIILSDWQFVIENKLTWRYAEFEKHVI